MSGITKEEAGRLAKKLSSEAQQVALSWKNLKNPRNGKPNPPSKNKIRKFFSEFRRIERIYNNGGSNDDSFNKILPQLKMIISKVYYDAQRSGNSLPIGIRDFFKREIEKINDKTQFEEFMLYFEAILGFAELKD